MHIFKDARRTKRHLYCVFVDWHDAYNGVDQDVIWECLQQMGVHSKDVDLISSLYDKSSLVQTLENKQNEPIEHNQVPTS